MLKPKYLRHPFQTAKTAKALLTTRFNMWKFAAHGKRRFKNDVRYDLQSVTNGFASHIDDSVDDTKILERICSAYIKSAAQEQLAPETYRAPERWQRVRQQSLGPIRHALTTQDIPALRQMYRNFFRDPCSAGLLSAPYGMSKAYFGGAIKDIHRRFYLGHALYRLDYWKEQTTANFVYRDLAAPPIGNPFGILIDGTLLRVGAEYAHYCAYRVGALLDTGKATIAEIGGGFGGMAYYLLRDRPKVTYCDFDIPESIALTSYYLMKAHPQLKFLLYGEEELTHDEIARADVVLMPTFEMAAMPIESVDITFSSHGMSEISPQAVAEYMNNIVRMTRRDFLYIGNSRASKSISDLVGQSNDSFRLTETRSSGWHSHKVSGAGVGGAAGLAASILFEQRYTRMVCYAERVSEGSTISRDRDLV
jgi:hypothetical protein